MTLRIILGETVKADVFRRDTGLALLTSLRTQGVTTHNTQIQTLKAEQRAVLRHGCGWLRDDTS